MPGWRGGGVFVRGTCRAMGTLEGVQEAIDASATKKTQTSRGGSAPGNTIPFCVLLPAKANGIRLKGSGVRTGLVLFAPLRRWLARGRAHVSVERLIQLQLQLQHSMTRTRGKRQTWATTKQGLTQRQAAAPASDVGSACVGRHQTPACHHERFDLHQASM